MSTSLIKDLRERTGAGMMDCKRALDEAKGDMEAAVDWLRKKGLASAAKKSGRVAAEGLVAVSAQGKKASMVELNSETDFVARNEKFQELAALIAKQAAEAGSDVEKLKSLKMESGKTVAEGITDAIATIGGFLGRKSDGEPGWRTMWLGFRDVLLVARALEKSG